MCSSDLLETIFKTASRETSWSSVGSVPSSRVKTQGMRVLTDSRHLVRAMLRQAPYGQVGGRSPWVKIKNREYSQALGRHEQSDGLRGEKRLARRA